MTIVFIEQKVDQNKSVYVKSKSNAFSNDSFGKSKSKSKNLLKNKILDKILDGAGSDNASEDSKNSLDLNIGKKVKLNLKNEIAISREEDREDKQLSSVSFLQDARNISRNSSVYPKMPSLNNLTSSF